MLVPSDATSQNVSFLHFHTFATSISTQGAAYSRSAHPMLEPAGSPMLKARLVDARTQSVCVLPVTDDKSSYALGINSLF